MSTAVPSWIRVLECRERLPATRRHCTRQCHRRLADAPRVGLPPKSHHGRTQHAQSRRLRPQHPPPPKEGGAWERQSCWLPPAPPRPRPPKSEGAWTHQAARPVAAGAAAAGAAEVVHAAAACGPGPTRCTWATWSAGGQGLAGASREALSRRGAGRRAEHHGTVAGGGGRPECQGGVTPGAKRSTSRGRAKGAPQCGRRRGMPSSASQGSRRQGSGRQTRRWAARIGGNEPRLPGSGPAHSSIS